MSLHTYSRTLATALLLLAATAAQAQYAWIGPNGTRQYSDQPPPPGTPASKILKAPGRHTALAEAPGLEPAPAPAGDKTDAPKAPPSVADREAAYQERKKAEAEEKLKADQAALQKQQMAERCATAREAQAQFQSGIRIAQVGKDGQRSFMSDEERAARSARVNETVKDCR